MPLTSRSRSPDPDRVRAVLGLADEPATGWVPRRPDLSGESRPAPEPDDGEGADDLGEELARLDEDLRRARRPGVLTVPDQFKRARTAVSGPALLAVLALLIAVGCLFTMRVLWAERSGGDVIAPGAAVTPTATGATGSRAPATGAIISRGGEPTAGGAGGATAAATAAPMVVHVVGQVSKPGLVRLRPGSRVAQAIAEAGGATRQADLGAVNLARVVVDGEQIHVPKPGETVPPAGRGATGAGATGSPPGLDDGASVVDLNSADLATLDGLPGVGPVLAQRIIDWRTEHGRFSSVDELVEVPGIGDKLLSQLKPKVRV